MSRHRFGPTFPIIAYRDAWRTSNDRCRDSRHPGEGYLPPDSPCNREHRKPEIARRALVSPALSAGAQRPAMAPPIRRALLGYMSSSSKNRSWRCATMGPSCWPLARELVAGGRACRVIATAQPPSKGVNGSEGAPGIPLSSRARSRTHSEIASSGWAPTASTDRPDAARRVCRYHHDRRSHHTRSMHAYLPTPTPTTLFQNLDDYHDRPHTNVGDLNHPLPLSTVKGSDSSCWVEPEPRTRTQNG